MSEVRQIYMVQGVMIVKESEMEKNVSGHQAPYTVQLDSPPTR